MVAINNIFLAGALAATVSAYPLAAAQPEANAVADVKAVLMARDLLNGDVLEKRASSNALPSLAILLGNAGQFLGKTVQSLLTLNLSSESDQIAQLLADVNSFLLNLETDLKNYTPTSGIGGLVQNLLVQSGLQSLVLALTTIVSTLGTALLKGGAPDAQVLAQLQALNDNLKSISDTIGAKGTYGNISTLLNQVVSSLSSLLSGL